MPLIPETEHVTPEQTDESKTFPDDAIKPLETKALNFLVNQYLLQINSKLTSVTFSEENEEQVLVQLKENKSCTNDEPFFF